MEQGSSKLRREERTESGIRILYEDNHLLVVEKPVNVPVQADASGDADLLSLLKAYIRTRYEKPGEAYLGLVHRLDRPVGGVMVFAKTSKAAARLSAQFCPACKNALLRVCMRLFPSEKTLRNGSIGREHVFRPRGATWDRRAKQARLTYALTAGEDTALLDIERATGSRIRFA
jgi:23S rRNA pseudouridine1911/1915/1917 synthase